MEEVIDSPISLEGTEVVKTCSSAAFLQYVAALIDNVAVLHLKTTLNLPHSLELISTTLMAPATKRRDINVDFFLF